MIKHQLCGAFPECCHQSPRLTWHIHHWKNKLNPTSFYPSNLFSLQTLKNLTLKYPKLLTWILTSSVSISLSKAGWLLVLVFFQVQEKGLQVHELCTWILSLCFLWGDWRPHITPFGFHGSRSTQKIHESWNIQLWKNTSKLSPHTKTKHRFLSFCLG